MQSGISASAELQSAFKDFLSNTSTRAILATIFKETIVPKTIFPSNDSFTADLTSLQSHIRPNEALYIFLRLDTSSTDAPRLAAITYVPNSAPVRQKMLFASTQKTLLRELGTENFVDDFFCTEAEELSPEGWKRHEAHGNAANPLTEEERNNVDLREAEATEVGGTGRRGAGYGSSGLGMKAQDGVVEALRELQEGSLISLASRARGGWISDEELADNLQKIDASETITLADSVKTGLSPSDVASHISTTEPRYSFYRHSYGSESPIIFIYTCPTAAKVKERMVYASSRRSAEQLAQGEAGLVLAKKLEASDPSDITAETIDEEFAPKQEQKSGFSKPKRPGRR